jgi:hypothetical protein
MLKITLALLAVSALESPPLPPYADAIRCAGLMEAASNIAGPESAEGMRRFDHAIFWGMAASEAGRKEGVASSKFKQDQNDARTLAEGQLKAADPAAQTELDACTAQVRP